MNNKFYVYGLFEKTENLIDECFYVGKGSSNRMDQHFYTYYKSNNLHRTRKINKIGEENVYASKIKDNLTEERAYELEEFIIEEIGLENLTNIVPGGDGVKSGKQNPFWGKTHTDEVKEKISKTHTGKNIADWRIPRMSERMGGSNNPMYGSNRSGENNPFYGESHTEETIDKMRKRTMGEDSPSAKLSEKEASEVKWLSRNSDLYQREIADKYDIDASQVSRIKNNKYWSKVKPKKPKNYE